MWIGFAATHCWIVIENDCPDNPTVTRFEVFGEGWFLKLDPDYKGRRFHTGRDGKTRQDIGSKRLKPNLYMNALPPLIPVDATHKETHTKQICCFEEVCPPKLPPPRCDCAVYFALKYPLAKSYDPTASFAPNSNTFVAHIMKMCGMKDCLPKLPATAYGKRYNTKLRKDWNEMVAWPDFV